MESQKNWSSVHVCSIIPGLAESLKEALDQYFPDLHIVDVPVDDPSEKTTMAGKLIWSVSDKQRKALEEAEILIAEGRTLAQLALYMPKLKWVQLTVTGADRLIRQMEHVPKPLQYVVTRNTSENIGQLMAEYVIGQIIQKERLWRQTHVNQTKKVFDRGDNFSLYRSVHELTIGILGLGPLGLEVARCLKTFRCHIVGFSRSPRNPGSRPPNIDEFWHACQLGSFLQNCDYVVNVLPSTPDTKDLLGKETLKQAKKSPVFINIGRGDIINTQDLLEALEENWISFAILDVFEEEPLSAESKLWLHPKIEITPHVAGFGSVANRLDSVVKTFMENYRRFSSNKELTGAINWQHGY